MKTLKDRLRTAQTQPELDVLLAELHALGLSADITMFPQWKQYNYTSQSNMDHEILSLTLEKAHIILPSGVTGYIDPNAVTK